MKLKKYAVILITLIIILTNYTTTFAQTQPKLSSEGIYFANSTGQVLISENENTRYQPGGIVKMITCLVALEKCNLADKVTITKESITKAETNASLKEGEVLTVEDLAYCAIVANASDASRALAIHVSGSEEAFVKLMNQKAKDLGCANTHFTNCTGSNDSGQYTTPSDLFKLTMASINNANLNAMLRTSCKSIAKTNMSEERLFYSYNYLICAYYDNRYFYSNAQGGKSGYTPDGGYALTAFATVGNTQLIAITMGGNSDDGVSTFNDSIALFKYGFQNYKSVPVTSTGDIVYETKIKYASPSDDIVMCSQRSLKALVNIDDEDYKFETVFNMPDRIEPPVKKGDLIGSATYYYNGHVVGEVPLVASEDLSATPMFYIAKFFSFLWSIKIIRILVYTILAIILIILFLIFSVMTGAIRVRKKPSKNKRIQKK